MTVRICDNPACMKPFTAKREKQRFCKASCKQAVFSAEKAKKQIREALRGLIDPNKIKWPEPGKKSQIYTFGFETCLEECKAAIEAAKV